MRAALLIAALACASAACAGAWAQTASESRYGPAPERAPTPVAGRNVGYTGATYGGRALGWAGKREMVASQPQAAARVEPWWARQTQQAAPAPLPRQPQTAPSATPAALPRNLYDTPSPQAAPIAADYRAPPSPAPAPGLREGQVGPRTYSVGRQFGMAPDPIPAAGPPRMVLITAPPAADDDKPRDESNGEWSAKPEKDSGQ